MKEIVMKKYFTPPADGVYIGFFIDLVKQRKLKFSGQFKPWNYRTTVKTVSNVESIVPAFFSGEFSEGFYVIRGNVRYTSGVLRGQVRWTKSLCWVVLIRGREGSRLRYFEFENFQTFPVISQ